MKDFLFFNMFNRSGKYSLKLCLPLQLTLSLHSIVTDLIIYITHFIHFGNNW